MEPHLVERFGIVNALVDERVPKIEQDCLKPSLSYAPKGLTLTSYSHGSGDFKGSYCMHKLAANG